MQIGIIGLPKSGKTTVFNALARGKAQTATYSTSTLTPNIGVVKVPDRRLDMLTHILKPKRTVPTEVTYIDIAAPAKGFGKGEGSGGQLLTYLSKVDALAHVVRAFDDERLPHPEGSVSPERDISTMNLELAFSDMGIIERRLERLTSSLKGAKPQERELISKEQALLEKIKSVLESDKLIREQTFTETEAKILENFQFLTAKPMLLLLNIGEKQIPEAIALEAKFSSQYKNPHCQVATLCGKLEMELSQLNEAEAKEFRTEMGIGESGLAHVISLSYDLLGLISFFTIASDEVKAWTIHRNTPAQKAAGKIHTDMEHGFIRAEVIKYDDLLKCGSLPEAKRHGLLRIEGKNYIVQDGDVVTILFNI